MSHLKDKRRDFVVTASEAWSAIYERQELWRRKTLREPPFEGNEATAWGSSHEYIALASLERELDDFVQDGNIFKVSEKYPLGASPDGFYKDSLIEIKCPFLQRIYPEIPEKYWFQMQIQMEVWDKEKCIFYIWTSTATSQEIVSRDREFINWYVPLAEEFLASVKSDTEPKKYKRKPIYERK